MKKSLLFIVVAVVGMLSLCPGRCLAQMKITASKEQEHELPPCVPHKGAIDIKSSLVLPVLNWLYYRTATDGDISRIGFGYWNLGVDYYHKDRQFLSLTVGESFDLKLPAALAYGFGGKDSENLMILHCSVTNNHRIGKFCVGYGLSYGYDRQKKRIYNDSAVDAEVDDYDVSYLYSNSLGFAFPIHYLNEWGGYIGVTYRPMLVKFSRGPKFTYQHTLSLDIGVKFRVKK